MFNYKHYVPVLRWKQSEQFALKKLNKNIKQEITPLIEPIPKKFQTFDRNEVIEMGKEIGRSWGQDLIFVDSHLLSNHTQEYFLKELFTYTSKNNLNIIPVTALNRSTEYQLMIANNLKQKNNNVCFRITYGQLKEKNLKNIINKVLFDLNVSPERVNLIIDFKLLTDLSMNFDEINYLLPYLNEWKSFTVLSGSFPKDLTQFTPPGIHRHPRCDWIVWYRETISKSTLIRKPIFGDYTIQYPEYIEPPKHANISASIRYTSETEWIIMRGEGLRNQNGPGFSQYPANAQLLCSRDEFCGPDFSDGDSYIYKMGQQQITTGSPRTWLTAGINHHLVFVSNQISNLS